MQEFFLGTDPNLVLPEPALGQLREIATRCVVPTFNRLLATFGASIEPDNEAMTMMAEVALETGTYARGVKSIVKQLVEDIVFEVRQGTVRLGVADVQRDIEVAGLGATTTCS